MWVPKRGRVPAAINRYWNALDAGAPPGELARLAEGIDPSLTAAVEQARALRRRRRPDPAFADRLERDLMQAFATAAIDAASTMPGRSRSARVSVPSPGRAAVATPRRPSRLGSAFGYAGAVALALVLLAGVAIVATNNRFTNDHRHSVVAPAATPPPAVATPAAAVSQELLARTGIETPEEVNWIGVSRATFAPGATLGTGKLENWSGIGPALAYVDAGTLTVTAEGAARWQAAGAVETELAAGTAQTVHAGDRLFIPTGVGATWTNTGDTEAAVLIASAVRETDTPDAETVPTGITIWQGIYTVEPFTAGAIDLRLERVTLPPGTAIDGAPGPELHMIGVERGTVEVTWARPDKPGIATGLPFPVDALGTLDVNTDRFYALAIANNTAEPAVILVFTAAPSATNATPTAG